MPEIERPKPNFEKAASQQPGSD